MGSSYFYFYYIFRVTNRYLKFTTSNTIAIRIMEKVCISSLHLSEHFNKYSKFRINNPHNSSKKITFFKKINDLKVFN